MSTIAANKNTVDSVGVAVISTGVDATATTINLKSCIPPTMKILSNPEVKNICPDFA